MFGLTHQERTLEAEDFYVPPGATIEDEEERSLVIEAHLSIPELEDAKASCPPVFSQMLVTVPGGPPFCRVRLSGPRPPGPTPQGRVDQEISWIMSQDPEPKEEHFAKISGPDRA